MNRDAQLFVCVASVVVAVGAVMAHSASMTSRPTDQDEIHLSRHAAYLVVGICIGIAAAITPAQVWQRIAPWLFAATVVFLILVLIPGIGTSVNGARRWIRLGPISVQPSEIAKLTLPLMLGKLVVMREQTLGEWVRGTVPIVWPLGIILPLVLLEPDLGTTLFLFSGAAVLLFLAGWPLRNFAVGATIAIPAFVAIVLVQPYQLRRVTGFIAVWMDPASAPYQVRQALITLGSGGFQGTGLGQGLQKLSFLPEASTDFVFAVIGEELGLLGTLGLLAAWLGILMLGLRLFRHASGNRFEYLCGMTLLFQLVGQAVANMAVVTALLPPKGIALPLVSYGGSNLVVSLAAIGMILSLSRATEPEPA